MSEIQSLTTWARDLSQSVDWWNSAMIGGLALAAIATVFVVIATRIVVARSGQLSKVQGFLSEAKDRQLQSDLKAKDVEIGKLKIDLGGAVARAKEADARIAEAQRGAADANKKAEDERLARVELQKLVAWRTIPEEKQKEIAARLKRFPGVRIAFTVNAGDPEGFAFGTQIASIAIEAGWQIIGFSPITHLGAFRTGLTVTTTGDRNAMDASNALVRELNVLHFGATRWPEIDPRTDTLLYVNVHLRPQAIPNKVSEAIANQK